MEIDSGAKTFIRFTGVNRRSLASWTGTLGLAGVALGLGASTAAVNIGILLLLLGAVLVLDDIVDSIGIGNALLAAALTAFLLFVTLWAIYHFGIDAHAAWKEFGTLAKIAGLPSLAAGWWLSRGHLRYHHLLILFSLSVIIGCIGGLNIEMLLRTPFAGKEIIITNLNRNELGFLAGILFMISGISLLLDERAKSSLPGSGPVWNILFILTAGLTGFLVITSQSRAIILGICIALVATFCIRILSTRHKIGRPGRRYALIAISTLVLLGLITFSPLGQVLSKRFDGIEKSLYLLTNLNGEPLPDFKDNKRLLMWQESISLIAVAPLTGHGPGTAPALMAKSPHTEIRHYSHFHSLWLHWAVIIGIPGALGFAVLFLALAAQSARDAVRHDRHISWSALGLWVYFFFVTLVQLRINHSSGQAFVILVGGMSYYCAFDTRLGKPGR
ncbi:MAG: O-antigen ligase family protein [Gammaproteobacteria bacterium]|nr:O-antigen ligase family protein [Gammaproteobacteria bacterium]